MQFAGKDNLRQQSAMWQAMLLAADLPPTKQILIHGFITVDGQKISKSLGNVINPVDYVKKYGTDALRYYMLAKISPFEDSDFTKESFEQVYQADLANGLGNLVARIARMAELNEINTGKSEARKLDKFVIEALDSYRFDWALEEIWKKISSVDIIVNRNELWRETKSKKKFPILVSCVEDICQIAHDLQPFLPETANKILNQYNNGPIKSGPPLFPRLK